MRGQVLYYDEKQGFGFLLGVDGNRYTFTAEDLRRLMPIEAGMIVEFQPKGDKARDIFAVRSSGAGSPALTVPRGLGQPASPVTAPPAPTHFGRQAMTDAIAPHSTGLWAYFRRGLGANYANFKGRARRKEYWGFFLFWLIAFVLVMMVGMVADAATGNLDTGEGPILMSVAAGLFFLATFIPSLAITVRRIHDIGMSGWFYLLILIPYIGGLIILVFTLVPSQKNDNKWGPVPEGIRV
jgi:uncharacterized membrane protein YhaH (DUF805 family)/cold shock CspA family protein